MVRQTPSIAAADNDCMVGRWEEVLRAAPGEPCGVGVIIVWVWHLQVFECLATPAVN